MPTPRMFSLAAVLAVFATDGPPAHCRSTTTHRTLAAAKNW